MLILIYIFAISCSNLLAAHFGAWVTPITAFIFIGLELVVRDLLHHKLTKLQMVLVIFVAGVTSFLINHNALMIAVGSFAAVVLSCAVDYAVYSKTIGTWFKKSNTSNFFSSLVDSLVFPLIAFGAFMPLIILGQWAAKFFGGFLWSLIIKNTIKPLT